MMDKAKLAKASLSGPENFGIFFTNVVLFVFVLTTVKRLLPVLHYSVVYILWYLVSKEPIPRILQNYMRVTDKT